MKPFHKAIPAPPQLLLLASFSAAERTEIDTTPSLKAAIEAAPPAEWPRLLERHRLAERAGFSKCSRPHQNGDAHECDPEGRPPMTAIRHQALSYLRRAAEDYASLSDGRRTELFRIACRLGKYVTHRVISESEFKGTLQIAASQNGALEAHGHTWFEDCVTRALRYAENDDPPLLRAHFRFKNRGRG